MSSGCRCNYMRSLTTVNPRRGSTVGSTVLQHKARTFNYIVNSCARKHFDSRFHDSRILCNHQLMQRLILWKMLNSPNDITENVVFCPLILADGGNKFSAKYKILDKWNSTKRFLERM